MAALFLSSPSCNALLAATLMTLQYLQVTPWTLALLHNDGSETFLVLFLQKDKGSGAVAKAIFGQLSPKLLASINFMYVYACTGQGKAAMKEHATARTCIRLAVRDKDYLFTAADSAKFSSMIVMSEVASQPHCISCMRLGVCLKLVKFHMHCLPSWLHCMSSLAWD